MAVNQRSQMARTFALKSWRDFTPMNTSVGTMLHNRTGSWRFLRPVYEDKIPACQNACPAGNDIEGWLKLLLHEKPEQACRHLKREEPFPAILGRVCFQFCAAACNRGVFDHALRIRELERYLGERFDPAAAAPPAAETHGARLAVVGSGPAGMSAAYFGRLLGFEVTVFEALPHLGGLLSTGIPSYRLPKALVRREFEGLQAMGVALRPRTAVGGDVPLDTLQGDYDFVFLATGSHRSLKLGIAGEQSPHVLSALDFLRRIAAGQSVDIGSEVVVVGGGNTTIDAARTALRLGCRVTLLYRRGEQEMPAYASEVAQAREEGVAFHFLAAPEQIALQPDGSIAGVHCRLMELAAPDATGRRRPVPSRDGLFEMPADTLLTAIGEMPSLAYLRDEVMVSQGMVAVTESLQTLAPTEGVAAAVFAGGDLVDMPRTVVHAVAAGKRAAIAMDAQRRGLAFTDVLADIAIGDGAALSFAAYRGWEPVDPVARDRLAVVGPQEMVYDYFTRDNGSGPRVNGAAERRRHFEPYEDAYDDAAALAEAARCMHCGRCIECDNCLIFCPDMSVLPRPSEQFGYTIDLDYCKGCGICFTECPRRAISLYPEESLRQEEEGE